MLPHLVQQCLSVFVVWVNTFLKVLLRSHYTHPVNNKARAKVYSSNKYYTHKLFHIFFAKLITDVRRHLHNFDSRRQGQSNQAAEK